MLRAASVAATTTAQSRPLSRSLSPPGADILAIPEMMLDTDMRLSMLKVPSPRVAPVLDHFAPSRDDRPF